MGDNSLAKAQVVNLLVQGCTDQFRIWKGLFSDSTKACLTIMMTGVNHSDFQYFLN